MKRLCDIIECAYDIPILGIKTDSRKVMPGDLFFAIKGYQTDHKIFIDDAIERGAVAVIGEDDLSIDTIYIKVLDVNQTLLQVLTKFYDHIEKDFYFIGITGTDGKTTTATITANILDCGYIGTNGVFYKDNHWTTSNTTPEVCDFYEQLVKLKDLGCRVVVMEVSSEALLHRRVDNILFDIVSFTNITEDHLNVHKTLENYVDSKKKLFSLVKKNGVSILNIDDSYYQDVKDCCLGKTYSYGQGNDALFRIDNIHSRDKGSDFYIVFQKERYFIQSNLFGIYNIYNVCLAFVIAYSYGMDIKTIIRQIKKIKSICGRGEFLDFGQNYTIILDYAHTYNGIYNIIMNLKQVYQKKIIVVTGAAGGREVSKRARIGKMLLENVSYVIFTMDDPRWEDVDLIIDQLLSSTSLTNYERIIDRNDAINKAFSLADSDSLVLIIGKGRDSYMAIGDEKVPYCDYEIIEKYFKIK